MRLIKLLQMGKDFGAIKAEGKLTYLRRVYQEEAELLLNKYGPEGLYALAKILIECADKDISEANDDNG